MAKELDMPEADQAGDAKRFTLSVAKAKLSELVDEVRTNGTHVVIQRRSKPAAVLVGVDEFEELSRLRDSYRAAQIARALKGELYDLDEVLLELDLGL